MSMNLNCTNVVVLYGSKAAAHFIDMANHLAEILPSSAWDSIQFMLVTDERPNLAREDLRGRAASCIDDRNTVVYYLSEPVPTAGQFTMLIEDKIHNGNVAVHLMCNSGNDELDYTWLEEFCSNIRKDTIYMVELLYYFFVNMQTQAAERGKLIRLLQNCPGRMFMLTATNETGGKVSEADRWHAADLAMVLNGANQLPLRQEAFSVGYSTLNADGSELDKMCQSAVCSTLLDQLNDPLHTLSAADYRSMLLPKKGDLEDGKGMDVENVTQLREWLQLMLAESKHSRPSANAWKNVWTTIRMDRDLPAGEAIKRLQRFVDLNYANASAMGAAAEEKCYRQRCRIIDRLRRQVCTACIPMNKVDEIIAALERIANEEIQPMTPAFGKLPFLKTSKAMEAYMNDCQDALRKAIIRYIDAKSITVYARAMLDQYRQIQGWLRNVVIDEDVPYRGRRETAENYLRSKWRELESPEGGNAAKLRVKYKHFAEELSAIAMPIQQMLDGVDSELFRENGQLQTKNWDRMVERAARNVRSRMSPEFRRDFFRALKYEFTSEEERRLFFDANLQPGSRMYHNPKADASAGESFYVVGSVLYDDWFVDRKMFMSESDNAENLTLYPLGSMSAVQLLQEDSAYFKGADTGTTGHGLFSAARSTGRSRSAFGEGGDAGRSAFGGAEADNRPRRGLFAERGNDADQEMQETDRGTENYHVSLDPDTRDHYILHWDWHDKDETALVTAYQAGHLVGKAYAITAKDYMQHKGLDFSDMVLQGKPVPEGNIEITIAGKGAPFVNRVEVPGRRITVRYKLSNNKLDIKVPGRSALEWLLLVAVDPDGQTIRYPLYAANSEHPYFYENLMLMDGRIETNPTNSSQAIVLVRAAE